jgi:hypothetical protein
MGGMIMRAWSAYVIIATLALGVSAARGQFVKPKYPREITQANIAQRNENCRREAREQHLHLLKRYRFMRACQRQ